MEDEKVGAETRDQLVGPATIAELRKTVAVCTQTHQTELEIIPGGCYTDGTTIYVAPPPNEIDLLERWILLEAATIHESWHILFQSDFLLLKKFVEKYERKYRNKVPYIKKIAHDIVNLVEDARIESCGVKRFYGTKSSIDFSHLFFIKKRPSFKALEEWEMFIEVLLQLGVCGGLKEKIPNSKVELCAKAANFYLFWVKNNENSGASFRATEKILDLLLKFFEIQGPYEQKVPAPSPKTNFNNQKKNLQEPNMDIPDLPKNLQKKLDQLEKKLKKKKEKGKKKGASGKEEKEEENSDSGKSENAGTEVSNDLQGQSSDELGESEGNSDKFGAGGETKEEEDNISGFGQEESMEGINDLDENSLEPELGDLEEEKSSVELEAASKLNVINLKEMDPFKSGRINPHDLRIKIDDLIKRNYRLLKNSELEIEIKKIIKKLENLKEYRKVFHTNSFDIGVEADLKITQGGISEFEHISHQIRTLIHVTINQFKSLFKSGSQITPKLKFGRLDSHKMLRGLINEDPYIFRKNIKNEGKNEIAIALLIDQSGSMAGQKIFNAQKAAILFGEVLNALNLNFAIYGWTDMEFYPHPELIQYLNERTSFNPKWIKSHFPEYINNEIFTVFNYKGFEDNYDNCRHKLGLICALCDNSDHNAIEYMTEKLLETKKRIKILMILSDGQPNARSYEFIGYRLETDQGQHHNRGNIGINLTRQAIEIAQRRGIQTLCISIDSVKNYQEQIYGANNYLIIDPSNIDQLPVKVAKILTLILRRAGVKV